MDYACPAVLMYDHGPAGYKNLTESCFWWVSPNPTKMPLQGPLPWRFHHPDSNQVSCLTNGIGHARVNLGQYPSNVSFFNMCCVHATIDTKSKSNAVIFFCFQWKLLQWMMVLVGLHVSYIGIYQFWNCIQANTSNRTAEHGRELTDNWEDVRWYLMNRILA